MTLQIIETVGHEDSVYLEYGETPLSLYNTMTLQIIEANESLREVKGGCTDGPFCWVAPWCSGHRILHCTLTPVLA